VPFDTHPPALSQDGKTALMLAEEFVHDAAKKAEIRELLGRVWVRATHPSTHIHPPQVSGCLVLGRIDAPECVAASDPFL
jgi:hypothetical protein